MAQQGAVLQSYNNELVKCIEELRIQRDELQKQILEEEEEKRKLQTDIRTITDRLSKITASLGQKVTSKNEFDKTITETEAAYTKILESSQLLVDILRKEKLNTDGSSNVPKSLPSIQNHAKPQ